MNEPVTLRRFVTAVLVFVCVLLPGLASAVPITIPVLCGGATVGNISVDVSPTGAGVTGGFTSTTGGPPPTLAAAAAACGEDHFNWYQIVIADNMPPRDARGNTLTPPYVDPPPGGYSNQWADNLPWYWDEYAPPAGTPNFDPNLLLSANTTAARLGFADFPGGAAGTNLSFITWLVSLNADSSFHAFEGGFSWDWSNATGRNVASNLLAHNADPTRAQYNNLIGGFATSTVPEPSTFALLAMSLGLLYVRRRHQPG